MNRDRGKRTGGFGRRQRAALWLALLPSALLWLAPVVGAAAQTNPWTMPGGNAPWYQPPQTYPNQSYTAPTYPAPGQGYPAQSYPRQTYPGVTWPQPPQPARQQAGRSQQGTAQPSLDVTLEADSAYVHQGLVVTVEVASDGNLGRIDVALPKSDAVIFRDIGSPTARAETRNGKRRIVTERHYQLIPLKPGRAKLDPVKVDGTFAEGGEFEVTALRGIDIEVLPPEPNVQPWLPLRDLQLSVQLLDDDIIGEGKPLKLVIEQRAVGMVGAQLPSPERQLKAEGHQLYRDSSDFDAEISADGHLTGKRTDRFTLVPLKAGRLTIPEISVAWWNVDKKRKELSIIPSRRLESRRADDDAEVEADRETARGSGRMALETPLIWGGLVALAFLAGLAWRGLAERMQRWDASLFRGRFSHAWGTARRHAATSLSHAFAPALDGLDTTRRTLSPRRNYHRARTFFANSLPRPLRLWFCVRTVQKEANPEDWASILRFVMKKRLGISAQKPMGLLAAEIAEIHPGSDRKRLDTLLRQLEAAAYGRAPLSDFEAWKRAFMREISPHPWHWFRRRTDREGHAGLPTLNPEME